MGGWLGVRLVFGLQAKHRALRVARGHITRNIYSVDRCQRRASTAGAARAKNKEHTHSAACSAG